MSVVGSSILLIPIITFFYKKKKMFFFIKKLLLLFNDKFLKNHSFIFYGEMNQEKLVSCIVFSLFIISKFLKFSDSYFKFLLDDFIVNYSNLNVVSLLMRYVSIITCGRRYIYSKFLLNFYKSFLNINSFSFNDVNIKLFQIYDIVYRSSVINYCKTPHIYIVYCIDDCNSYVVNSLLKIIEDGNDNLYFIFVCFNITRVLDTLLSRCFKLNLDSFFKCNTYTKPIDLCYLNFIDKNLIEFLVCGDLYKFIHFCNNFKFKKYIIFESFFKVLWYFIVKNKFFCFSLFNVFLDLQVYYIDIFGKDQTWFVILNLYLDCLYILKSEKFV